MIYPYSLLQSQKEAEVARERAFRFFRWLKTLPRKQVDALAKATHIEVFQSVDCLGCTNCCQTLKPDFREHDLDKVAVHLGLSMEALKASYLQQNPQGIWQPKTLPCPFLASTGHCTIYAVRPVDCRDFPHTDKTSFAQRSWTHAENVVTCPAVYGILERMEEKMGWVDE